jgi:hypothetical protein
MNLLNHSFWICSEKTLNVLAVTLTFFGCQRAVPSNNPSGINQPGLNIHQQNYWRFIKEFNGSSLKTKPQVTVKKIKGADNKIIDEVINSGIPVTKVQLVTAPDQSSRTVRVEFDAVEASTPTKIGTKITKQKVEFIFPSDPTPDRKAADVIYNGEKSPYYFSRTPGGNYQNRDRFFQLNVMRALQLSAQTLNDHAYALAVSELLRDARKMSTAENLAAPYQLRLDYTGTSPDKSECSAKAYFDADGNLMGLTLFKQAKGRPRSRAFSIQGLLPIVNSEKTNDLFHCSILHPSLRTWLSGRAYTEGKIDFSEDLSGAIHGLSSYKWESVNMISKTCETSTYAITACDGSVKGKVLDKREMVTPIGPFSTSEESEYECNNLQLISMKRGIFITEDVVLKVMQRPLFGRAPLATGPLDAGAQ